MNVCLLIWDYWPGPQGGSERQCRMVSQALAAKGLSCTVLTSWSSLRLPRAEKDGLVSVRRFGFLCPCAVLGRRMLSLVGRLFRRLRPPPDSAEMPRIDRIEWALEFWLLLPIVWLARLSFLTELWFYQHFKRPAWDVMHLHEPSWLGGVAVGLSRGRWPVLCQEATYPALPEPGYDVPLRGRWRALRTQAHYIAMAPFILEDLQKKGIPANRIFAVPNGVRIPPQSADARGVKEALYVGNFSQRAHWKAFDVLFRAWADVHKTIPDAHLSVVGGGSPTFWREYARGLGCLDSVSFAGRQSHPELFYAKALAFLLPSRVEGMSNALLEAQSWGLACVVSDIPANRAVIRDGDTGIVVPVGDPAALAGAIIDLFNDAPLALRLGQAGRHRMQQEFGLDVVVEKVLGVYDQVRGLGGPAVMGLTPAHSRPDGEIHSG